MPHPTNLLLENPYFPNHFDPILGLQPILWDIFDDVLLACQRPLQKTLFQQGLHV